MPTMARTKAEVRQLLKATPPPPNPPNNIEYTGLTQKTGFPFKRVSGPIMRVLGFRFGSPLE